MVEHIEEEQILVVEDTEVEEVVVKTDGQSEINSTLAKHCGIIPRNAGPTRPCLYGAGQWRSFLPTDRKGMFLVDPFLKEVFRLRQSCVKLEARGLRRALFCFKHN